MEPWVCTKHNFDVRTACNDGPFYQRAEFDPVLSDLEDFGPRIRFRPVHAEGADSCQRNADGTINVVVESRCKLRDEEGFEFYVRDEEMPFDEDRFHEFKGHRSLAADECPKASQSYEFDQLDSTRKPVSQTLNAFINSPGGGTVYLGVLDNGSISGMLLSDYQKDHIVGNVKDLFSRYDTPVSEDRWKVRFVPVVNRNRMRDDLDLIKTAQGLSRTSRQNNLRQDVHVFRKDGFCWCDREAMEILRRQSGTPPVAYVVEIEILPRVKQDDLDFATIHADEMGKVFFRRNASNARPMVDEIVQYLRCEVDDYYRPLKRQSMKEYAEVSERDP